MIGLVTLGAPDPAVVVREIAFAHSLEKPVIVLVERGMQLQLPDDVKSVVFDRNDPHAHEHELIAAIQQIRAQQKRNEVFWLVGITLGMLGLAAVLAAHD